MQEKHIILKSGLIYFLSALAFLLVMVLDTFKIFAFLGSARSPVINSFIQVGIIFLLPFCLYKLIFKKKNKEIFLDVKCTKVRPKVIGYSFLLGITIFLGVMLISMLTQMILAVLGYTNPFASPKADKTVWDLLLSVLLTCIFPALFEEFLNRGILMQGLRGLGAKRAILFSALLFGLMHYNINQAPFAFVIGILLGFLVYISGSIWPSVIVHFTNNFIATISSFLQDHHIANGFLNFLQKAMFGNGNLFIFLLSASLSFFAIIALVAFCTAKIYNISRAQAINQKLAQVAQNYVKTESVQGGKARMDLSDLDSNKQEYEGEVFVKLKEAIAEELAHKVPGKRPLDIMLPKDAEKDDYKPTGLTMLWVWSSIVLTGLITFATFVWGLL